MDNYAHDYRTLGASPGCNLQTLKAARRRLIKAWHPDRFPADSSEKLRAEERIKDINTAFDRLCEYHQAFGALPAAEPAPEIVVERTTPESFNSRPTMTEVLPQHSSLHWTFAFVAAIALTAWFVGSRFWSTIDGDSSVDAPIAPSNAETSSPTQPIAEESRRTSAKYFTVGSSLGEVYAAQGVPTRIENGVWHYGKSKVYFADGVVTSWEHDSADPLNATALPMTPNPESTGFFSLGATKARVRAVQGAPLLETDSIWDYGLSKIYFRDNLVVGWDSSPMQPLKTRR